MNLIREFAGTLFLNDIKKGIYVTTAKKFAPAAERKKEKADRKFELFEFVNYDKIYSLLDRTETENPWQQLINKYYENTSIEGLLI